MTRALRIFGAVLLILFVVGALAVGFSWAFNYALFSAAHAQTADEPAIGDCHPYESVAAILLKRYGEEGTGETLVESTGSAVEVFIGPLGTLSVVEVFPDKTTCYRAFNTAAAAHGQGWGIRPKVGGGI